jgi:acyl-CoA thioester hydrolase
VLSEVIQVRAAACVIHQRVMRGEEILTDARVTAAFITNEGRPKRQPRAWTEIFERLLVEGKE